MKRKRLRSTKLLWRKVRVCQGERRALWAALRSANVSLLTLSAILTSANGGAALALGPYGTPDVNTIYLFHLNEPPTSTVAANVGSAGFSAVAYDGVPNVMGDQPLDNTILGAAGLYGFSRAADLNAVDKALGIDVDGSGGFQIDEAGSGDRQADHSSIMGVSDSFTLEAMINLPSLTGTNREIISTDNSGANDTRGFQFRVTGAGELEFHFIGAGLSQNIVDIQSNAAPGHQFVANEWFHAAFVYDGTAGMGQLYWTRVDGGATSAQPLGAAFAQAVDASDPMTLVIGNEARESGAGPGSNEGLLGLIDEVRISNIARTADQFIFDESPAFVPGDVTGEGDVNMADFNIIKMNLFKNVTMRSEGDLNEDGVVNFYDFREWKDNAMGIGAGVNLFGTPEPSSALLAGIGGLGLGLFGRRPRRNGVGQSTAGLANHLGSRGVGA